MYRPAASRSFTVPAGMSAVRLNGAACASTGSFAYVVEASAAFTVSAWMRPIRSMIGTSLYGASAIDRFSLQVPIGWLTYLTTFLCCSVSSFTIFGSSGTVLEFSTRAESEVTCHSPLSNSTSKSKQESRWPQQSGSERTTVFPVCLLTIRRCGTSLWVWPTSTASIPGTVSAISPEASSG